MTKLEKVLKRFNEKERKQVKSLIKSLIKKRLTGLDIKKLSGYKDIFRVRKNNLRVVYQTFSSGKVIIIKIDRRSDTTYNL